MSDKEMLAHFGVKGMRWGVVRKGSADVSSDDAKAAVIAKDKIRKGGTKALSNKELQNLVTRMNLEQQFDRLKASEPSKFQKGRNFVRGLIAAGKITNEIIQLTRSPAMELIKMSLKR